MDIRCTDLGGLTAFHVEAPGPSQAWLVWRVGFMDETLRTRGITRLVTGLALDGVDSGGAAYGAFVGGPTTSIDVNGTAEQVATILRHVWRALEEPGADRLEEVREREILHSSWRRPDSLDGLLAMRFGPRGPGLAGQPELGLHHLDAAHVLAWRDQYFGPRNAALALKNVSPDDVGLTPRRPGTWRALPPTDPRPLPLPAWFEDGAEDVSASAVLPGTAGADAFTAVAVHRLRARLGDRQRHPVALDNVRLWPGTDHVVLHCGAPPRTQERVRDSMLGVFEEVAEEGPEAEELERRHRQLREWKLDPESAFARIEWAPHRYVLDPEGIEPNALQEDEPPTKQAVAAAARAFLDGALFRLPHRVGMPVAFRRLPASSASAVSGMVYARAPGLGPGSLVVGRDGVTITIDDRRVTIYFDRCEAMTRWPDGTRQIYGSDGFGAQFRPGEWVDGESAAVAIDAALGDVTVVMRPPRPS